MDHTLHHHVVDIFAVAEHLLAHVDAESPLSDAKVAPVFKFFLDYGLAAQNRGGKSDTFNNFFIAGAAADIPYDRLLYIVLRRIGVMVDKRLAGHHHPGGAEAALNGTHRAKGVDEGLFLPFAEPLRRNNGFACRPFRRQNAGTHRLSVDDDRTGAAGALAAAVFYRTQPQIVAQKAKQGLILRRLIYVSVHGKTV